MNLQFDFILKIINHKTKMFEQGHLTLSQVGYFLSFLTSLLLRSYMFKRGIFDVSDTEPTLGTGGLQERSSSSKAFLLCVQSADPGWRGQRGHSEFLSEGPVPSERPEQRGCGRAICFQSRSQKNPPGRAK